MKHDWLPHLTAVKHEGAIYFIRDTIAETLDTDSLSAVELSAWSYLVVDRNNNVTKTVI